MWKLPTRICKHTINVFSYSYKWNYKNLKSCDDADRIFPSSTCVFLFLHTLPGVMQGSKPQQVQAAELLCRHFTGCLCSWDVRAWACPYFKSQMLNSTSKRLSSASEIIGFEISIISVISFDLSIHSFSTGVSVSLYTFPVQFRC